MSKDNNLMDRFAELEAFFDYFGKCLENAGRKVEIYSQTLDSSLKSVLDRELAVKNERKMWKYYV